MSSDVEVALALVGAVHVHGHDDVRRGDEPQ